MLILLGVGVVVLGFLIRVNPLQVVAATAFVTGWAAAFSPVAILAAFGKAFNESRYVSLVFLVLRVIGLLERFGLHERARMLIARVVGNASAASPVMTAAIGLPLIVHKFGGSPAIIGAVGMLSGFCGTLTTPMAANFNIVPVALLELPDRNAVVRARLPTAILLLAVNTILMYVLVFRFGAHHA